MDSIKKFLLKLSILERNLILEVIKKILILDLNNLDIKKMVGKDNLYRVRKGKIRIIFKKEKQKGILLDINYRDKIYRK